MTKRSSEGDFGTALRAIDLSMIVYKPPDDARTWKPCDFMVWVDVERQMRDDDGPCGIPIRLTQPIWFECKDLPPTVVNAFPFSELRPSQLLGIEDARRVGIPYWLAVYWRRHKAWTISDAVRVLAWRDNEERAAGTPEGSKYTVTSIPRSLLMSRFGVDSTPANLASTLKAVLLGDI